MIVCLFYFVKYWKLRVYEHSIWKKSVNPDWHKNPSHQQLKMKLKQQVNVLQKPLAQLILAACIKFPKIT